MTIHLRIVQENQLIADLPKWPGPIPRKGDYLFHPPVSAEDEPFTTAGHVKTVTWRLYDRPPAGTRPSSFMIPSPHPYVEICI